MMREIRKCKCLDLWKFSKLQSWRMWQKNKKPFNKVVCNTTIWLANIQACKAQCACGDSKTFHQPGETLKKGYTDFRYTSNQRCSRARRTANEMRTEKLTLGTVAHKTRSSKQLFLILRSAHLSIHCGKQCLIRNVTNINRETRHSHAMPFQ